MTTTQIKQIEEIIHNLTGGMDALETRALRLEQEPLMFDFISDTRLCGIARRLRHATETIKAMSTGVDIAPLAPQQLDIPAFLHLVQRRRVLIHTLNQDTDRVCFWGIEEDAAEISWYDDGEEVELRIRPDDAFASDGETFTIHNVTFIIEEL